MSSSDPIPNNPTFPKNRRLVAIYNEEKPGEFPTLGKRGWKWRPFPKNHGARRRSHPREEAWLPFQQRLPEKRGDLGIRGGKIPAHPWISTRFSPRFHFRDVRAPLPRIPKLRFLLNSRSSRDSGKGSKGRNSQRIPGGVAVKIGFYSRAHPRSVPTATLQSGKKKPTEKKKKKIGKRKGIPKGREVGKEGIPG